MNVSVSTRAKTHLLVYWLPFFYGAITRLPFIYFVIHMRFHFDLTWESIGLFVGAYQAARVVISVATIFLPKVSHFVGTSLGLVGSILVLVQSNDDKVSFLLGTIAIGFSETLAASQTFLKNCPSVNNDIDLMSRKIKIQYAAVMFGVTAAFSIGGFVYDAYGINGIAVFGIIMSTCELLSFLLYLILDTCIPADEVTVLSPLETSNENENHDENEALQDHSQKDYFKQELDTFSASGVGANYINYILVITFGMESITIGYNLAVSPVFILEEFHKNTGIIGIMLASGAATGTIFSVFMTLSKSGQSFLKSYLPSPYNLFIALGGISISVLTAAIPFFPVHFIGLLFLMAFNDMAAVILNDIQCTISSSQSYGLVGPLGQVVRRSFNVVTAITGPLLFGVFSRLPYLVAGSTTGVWLIILIILIMLRMKNNDTRISRDSKLSNSFANNFMKMSFTKKEIIKRQRKEKKKKKQQQQSASLVEDVEVNEVDINFGTTKLLEA